MSRDSLFTIPAGTPSRACRGATCTDRVYFIEHPKTGNPHPISTACEHGVAPTASSEGKGVSHFSNCVDAPRFRTEKPAPARARDGSGELFT